MPTAIAGSESVGVDLEHRQVHHRVVLEHPGRIARAVEELDHDALDLVDDVVVGQDVAAAVDQHAGAHAADARGLVLLGREGPAAVRRGLLLAGDAHDGLLDLFDGFDDGRSAGFARRRGRRPRAARSRPPPR